MGNNLDYYEGYAKALRDVLEALEAAAGLRERRWNNVRTVLAWLRCLITDPDRLMQGKDVSMKMRAEGKKTICEWEAT